MKNLTKCHRIGGGVWQFAIEFFSGFFDRVLWFIQVLLVLYIVFHFFTWLESKNKIVAWILIFVMTFIVRTFASKYIGSFTAFSIPFFTIGAFASEFKSKCILFFNIALIPTLIYGIFELLKGSEYILFLCLIVSSMIILFTLWKPKFNCPVLLAALSFDIYLVHFKVLLLARGLSTNLALWEFLLLSIVVALSFHIVRTLIFPERKQLS